MTTDSDDDFIPLADRTVLGFRVLFLFGVLVGVMLAGAVLVWTGVAARALADPCERSAPTFGAVETDFAITER